MSDDSGILLLLAVGPAAAAGLYWGLYRHYRNTDKSHSFEHETAINAKPIIGSEQKVDQIEGTRETKIPGNNVSDYRTRVQRVKGDSS
jgi:hypothetical protein